MIFIDHTAAVVCSEEVDTANGIQWPSVIANTTVSINCTGGRRLIAATI